jgi:hypothetical protein
MTSCEWPRDVNLKQQLSLLLRLLEGTCDELSAHGAALADSYRGEDCGSSFLLRMRACVRVSINI